MRSKGGKWRKHYVTIFGCSLLSLANGRVEPIVRSRSGWGTSRCRSVEYATSIWSSASVLLNGLTGTLGSRKPVHQFSRETYGYIRARDAHIPAINDFEALLIRIESPGKGPRRITRERTTATDANSLGSKAGTWSISDRGVEGHSE